MQDWNPTLSSVTNYYLPFTALFADAPGEFAGDVAPGLGSVLGDAVHEDAVFFFGPGTLNHLRV